MRSDAGQEEVAVPIEERDGEDRQPFRAVFLTRGEFDLWDRFVDESPQGCLYDRTWWLDTVCDRYDLFVCRNEGGILGGIAVPYEDRTSPARRLLNGGRPERICGMPPLTKHLGALLRPSGAKSAHRLGHEKDVIGALIGALPPFAIFSQQFHPAFTNGLPFHWAGFQDAVCYTYVIDDLSDPERVWAGLRENIRREVRKAERLGVEVRADLPFERFQEVQRRTFERQGMPLPFTASWAERFERAMADRGCRTILGAVDRSGRLHAAAYLVWDAKGCHYVMGGGDPDLRTSGAHSLLLWRALNAAAAVARSFDFGGSMIEGVERFFRAFGGEQRRFFRMTKVASPYVRVRHDLVRLTSGLRDLLFKVQR